jgi:hypothetical protein
MIETRYDHARGCGRRKPGGLYLVAPGADEPCNRLPIPLKRCPTCDHGIKFSRSWTWVNGAALLAMKPCDGNPADCLTCPLSDAAAVGQEKVGLLWVGEQHYPTPVDFTEEAMELGVSRRIKTVPRDFVVGETWVWLAHNHCIPTEDAWIAGVFRIFRPQAIEYVVKGDETEKELEKLIDRGITPVRVVPVEDKEDDHGNEA